MIKVLQVGLGPLGVKIFQYISEKDSMQTIAAVDIAPSLNGQDLGLLASGEKADIPICNSYDAVSNLSEVDVVVLTTSSSMKSIEPQLEQIIKLNLPIVSTCEELTYPWLADQASAQRIDKIAKEHEVAVVSTGVNPGFLMDTLPTMLTSVCKDVKHIQVNRFQDARTRRLPFQQKIGAGLDLQQFKTKQDSGTLRHVGLTESMHFIAQSVGWELDHVEDVISPVVAEENITTEAMSIAKGAAMGVRQEGTASWKGEERIKLIFEAAVGTGVSYDEVQITGTPNINSRIEGGVHGDVATCSIVLNTIPNVLKTSPGLKTMADLPIVSFCK